MLYPIFLEIADAPCVVVGGGPVAQRKAQSLVAAGATVTIVAPAASPRLASLAAENKLEWIAEEYRPEFLEDAWLVFAATDDPELNRRIADDARERGAISNVAEPPEAGDFIVPATIKRGEVCLAVSTGGASPALARRLREQLEAVVGEEYGELAALLGELRPLTEERVKTQNKRQQFYEAIVNSEILELLREGRLEDARRRSHEMLATFAQPPTSP